MALQSRKHADWRPGASVPFSAVALLGARIRDDEHYGLTMTLRNFATPECTYVLPWRAAPLSFPMNGFDAALHSIIDETRAITPKAINSAVRHLNLSGAAGQAAVIREQRRVRVEEALVARIRAILSPEFPKHGCMDELTALLSPVGLSCDKYPVDMQGPLRKMRREITALRDFASETAGSSEIATLYCEIADCTVGTVVGADALLRDIDTLVENPACLFREWGISISRIRSIVDELIWLFDGWDVVIDFAAGNLFSLMDDTLAVRRLLALMPRPRVRVVH